MKVAACLSGQPRFFKVGAEYVKNNLIDRNNADVFIHAWHDDSKEGESYDSAAWNVNNSDIISSDTPQKILDLYSPTVRDYIFEPQIQFDVSEHKQNTEAPVFITFSMIYSWCKSIKLALDFSQSHGFEYDCIVKTRFDAGILSPVDLNLYDMSKMNYSDSIRNPLVLCDWLNFSSSENMKVYSLLFDNLDKYCKEGYPICGEEMLTKHMNLNGIERNPCPISFFLIRDEEFKIRDYFGRSFHA